MSEPYYSQRAQRLRLSEHFFHFTTDFSFVDNVMHLCSWPHCNRRTINSFMMMMMMMMITKCSTTIKPRISLGPATANSL